MKTITEKLAYIQGLAEGLKLDTRTPEGKILAAIIDLLEDVTDTVSRHETDIDQIFDELDAIDEDLTDVEDALLYDDDEDDDDDDDWDDDDWDDDDWEEDEDYSDDDWEDEEDDTDDDWENDSDSSWSDDAGSGSSGSPGSTGSLNSSGSTGGSDGSGSTANSSLTDPYSSLGSGSSSAPSGTDEDEAYDEDKIYHLGDIWTVPGQWRFTILKVEPTTFRDELPETDSGAVYYVYYRYENLGYVDPDGVWDGLYFDLSSADITDKEGYMGYSYPGQVENYATEAPVGGYAEGVSCIGVDTPGDFTIVVDKYDGKDEYREATFEIKVN